MRTIHLPRMLFAVVLLVAAGLLAGCGGSSADDASSDATTSSAGAGALIHADGLVSITDEGFQLTPAGDSKDEPIDFDIGPAVKRPALRALAASGTPTRVTFRLTESRPIAVTVVPAPRIEGLDSYKGMVASVDEGSVVIKGDDGARTFSIAPADAAAFDVAHLRDHARTKTLVRVYYDPAKPDAGIAYEDA